MQHVEWAHALRVTADGTGLVGHAGAILGPGTGPSGRPTGFKATYAGNAGIGLSWSDPGGLYQYDIRREDTANPGWTNFAYPVWDSSCSNHADN
jgi:hypothetical protein